MQIRTPRYKKTLYPEGQPRVGYHNDCFLKSDTDTLPSQKASVVRNGRGFGTRRSGGYRTLFDISAAGQYPTVGFARPGGLFAAPLGPGVASSTSR